jgi:PDZ domain-containing secreted protein
MVVNQEVAEGDDEQVSDPREDLRRVRPRRVLITVTILLLAFVGASFLFRSPWVKLAPGPAFNIAPMVQSAQSNPSLANPDLGGEHVLLLTVAVKKVSPLEGLWCQISSRCEVVSMSDPGQDPQELTRVKAQLKESIDSAEMAARAFVKAPTHPNATLSLDLSQVGGPSGGLATALVFSSALSSGSLTDGTEVAVTGTINKDGTVGAVGGVSFKLQTAEASGAKVILVPQDELNAAQGSIQAENLRIKAVGVGTLSEAVKYLCAHGATSNLCKY